MPGGPLAGVDGQLVLVATSCSVQTQQLMVSGDDNLAATVALSGHCLHLLLSLAAVLSV